MADDNLVLVNALYERHMRKYRPLLKAARREMVTPAQKQYLRTVAATAFVAGYRARDETVPLPKVRVKPFTAKPWKPI